MVIMLGIPEKPANISVEKMTTMNKGNLQHFVSHIPDLASIKSPSTSEVVNPSVMQEQLKYV